MCRKENEELEFYEYLLLRFLDKNEVERIIYLNLMFGI